MEFKIYPCPPTLGLWQPNPPPEEFREKIFLTCKGTRGIDGMPVEANPCRNVKWFCAI